MQVDQLQYICNKLGRNFEDVSFWFWQMKHKGIVFREDLQMLYSLIPESKNIISEVTIGKFNYSISWDELYPELTTKLLEYANR